MDQIGSRWRPIIVGRPATPPPLHRLPWENETRHTSLFPFFLFSYFEFLFHSQFTYACDIRVGLVLTSKYYLKLLSEKNEDPFFSDKKTRLSSNDSQHDLKILPKSAGQHRRQHEHGAKTGLRQSCGRVWPSLCSSLPWTNHIP